MATASTKHHNEGGTTDVKLSSFVQLLEKLITTGKSNLKLQMVEAFIGQFYLAHEHRSIFQLMRLLMPQLDRERGNYGLKESLLAKYYSEILLLPP